MPERVRSIPSTNTVRDFEIRRILDAIVQVLRYLESAGATAIDGSADGVNIGDGADVFAGLVRDKLGFRRVRGRNGVEVRVAGDTLEIRSSGGSAGGGASTDERVGISSSDENPGYLADKLTGDGAFIKVEAGEDPGTLLVRWNGIDVGGYNENADQLAGHAAGTPGLWDVVTAVGAPGSASAIPTEQAVRAAIPSVPYVVTTVGSPGSDANVPSEQAVREAINGISIPSVPSFTTVTVVTAVGQDATTGALQYKTRTVKVVDPGTESGWTTFAGAEDFECPEGV
jgi:hypothetical protein